jgi:hypothetical protein
MNTEITPAQYADRKYVNKWLDSPAQKGGIKSKEDKLGIHNPEISKIISEIWSAERMKQTEEKFPKELIIETHKKFKTFNDVINHLGIWWGTYVRLCEVYKIKPIKWDKTTKNCGPSKPILVYRLIEIPREIYSSKNGEAVKSLWGSEYKGGIRIQNEKIDWGNTKIKYQTDKNGRKFRAYFTGNETQYKNRTPSKEVQIYELVEELVLYSNLQTEFPSREEVYRQLGDLAIKSQLKGMIYQSKGYRFYELN